METIARSSSPRRWQFSLQTVLLLTLFLAIAAGGISFVFSEVYQSKWEREIGLWSIIFLSPVWLSMVFLAYALGRRTLSFWLVAACTLTELVAIIAIMTLLVWLNA